LRQGLIYYNSDRNTEALSKFKKVAADFPKSAEALERFLLLDLFMWIVEEWGICNMGKNIDFIAVTDVT
jgi:hypothetical protein